MSSKFRLALFTSCGILILDQVTKVLVQAKMPLFHSIEVIPHFASLTYVRNTGAAFGILAGGPSALRAVFFIAVSLVAIGCILYLLKSIRPGHTSRVVSLSLILGGALGNLIDRLRIGEVVDFIDLHWYDLHWPAFNVADSGITIGVLFVFIHMLQKKSLDF